MNAVDTVVQSSQPGNAKAKSQRYALVLVLLFAAVSILPPMLSDSTLADFRAIYVGARCLLSHHNPYQASELAREYQSEDGPFPPMTASVRQNFTLFVNVPTTFVLLAPVAWMSWTPAHLIWMLFSSAVFLVALLLMWETGAKYSLEVSTLLTCFFAVNCQASFYTGNTALLVVGLCVIAVWCFLRDRFVWAGVLCMGVSLAVKPHDPGFIWLYFLLAAGLHRRKAALQSLLITTVIAMAAVLWVGHVAPHWLQDWRANLATIGAQGGINDPGPHSVMGEHSSLVVDLQAAISIFRDDPRVYNGMSYLVCGALLLVWMIRTVRSRFTFERAFLALSAVTALTLLITYHRPWDARLVMLAIPACCMLWARGGRLGKAAFWVTMVSVVANGDLTTGALTLVFQRLHPGMETLAGKVETLLILRPVSLVLLVMGVFYLWVFVRPPDGLGDGKFGEPGNMG